MVISTNAKQFIIDIINYYINESDSYRQMAKQYETQSDSVNDVAFGIIFGLTYSHFLQLYQKPSQVISYEEDIKEFHQILKEKSSMIMSAISKVSDANTNESPQRNNPDPDPEFTYLKNHGSDKTKKLYFDIKNEILSFNDNIKTKTRKRHIGFKLKRKFVHITVWQKHINLDFKLKKEDFSAPKHVLEKITNTNTGCQYKLHIEDESKISDVIKIIKQSYSKISN